MKTIKIAILTSESSWINQYIPVFVEELVRNSIKVNCYHNHKDILKGYNVVFILSYFKIIESSFLSKNGHNIVVHESDLPKGRGWSPLFWQILEGQNKIPIVLFEASAQADTGPIYIKDFIDLDGTELHDEIRKKQALITFDLCSHFIDNINKLSINKQSGDPSFYPRRTPKDSQLDINKSIKEQFNLLRITSNEDYPAFFEYNDSKYIIKIYKENENAN